MILSQCYSNGKKQKLDDSIWTTATKNDSIIDYEKICGYSFLSSFDELPDNIHGIFLSPPWGGVNYEDVGPRHYNIQTNIELISSAGIISCSTEEIPTNVTTSTTNNNNMSEPTPVHATDATTNVGGIPTTLEGNHQDNVEAVVNGEMLLQYAVQALPIDRLNITYYLPRNINGIMFGQSCYNILVLRDNNCAHNIPGPQQHCCRDYIHHIELEQNIVNTKLKTVTAYIQSRCNVKT
jgi:hypothetical protein